MPTVRVVSHSRLSRRLHRQREREERQAGLSAAYARPGFNMPKLWRWLRRALALWGACAACLLAAFLSFLHAHPQSWSPDPPAVSATPLGHLYGRPSYTADRWR